MRLLILVIFGILVIVAEVFSIRYVVKKLVHRRAFVLPTVLLGILVGMLLPFNVVHTFYLLSEDFGIYGIPFPEAVMKMEGDKWVGYAGPVSDIMQFINSTVLFLAPQIIAAVIRYVHDTYIFDSCFNRAVSKRDECQ